MKRKVDNDSLTVIKNITGAFFVKGGSLILSMLMLPAYIKFFNNETILGIWYTMLSVLHWILFFDFGLGQGLRNQLPSAIVHDDTKAITEYVSTTYILILLFTVALCLTGLAVIPLLNWNDIFGVDPCFVNNETLITSVFIVFSGILLQLILQTVNYILYALQRSALVNLLSLLSNLLIYIMINIIPSRDLGSNLITISFINIFAVNIPLLIITVFVFRTLLPDVQIRIHAFRRKCAKECLGMGLRLLWLQTVFMVVSSTNEFLITNLTGPENVVEYQAYRKVFSLIPTVFSLAITPIWSAVTKAMVQARYHWVKNLYIICICLVMLCGIFSLLIVPFSSPIMEMWLGGGLIDVKIQYSIIVSISCILSLLHNVNTSIGNGMGYFTIQMLWMSVAAAIFIPLAHIFVQSTGSWIGVIIANIISLLPYELMAPIFTIKKIKQCHTK